MVTKTSNLSAFVLHMSFSSLAQDTFTKTLTKTGLTENCILGAGAPTVVFCIIIIG